MSDFDDFEAWLAAELRRPAPSDPTRTERVMARVRRTVPRTRRRHRWTPPALGLAVAAGLAGLVALNPLDAARPGAAAIGGALRDTIRDTLRGAMEVAVLDTSQLAALAATGSWNALVTAAPGRHRYTYVVNDTQWIAEPARARADTTN